MKLGISDKGFGRIAQELRPPDEQALMAHLQQWIEDTKADLAKYDLADMFADVTVWSPEEAEKYKQSDSVSGQYFVTLVYDGAGHDFLTVERSGTEKHRAEVYDIAAQHGFMTEDNNSWSMSFIPE